MLSSALKLISKSTFFSFLMLIVLPYYSCSEDSHGASSDIQQEIQNDLNDGLSSIPTFELDTANLPKTKYTAEKEHSSISFKTKHWEIVDLIGWFSDFDIVMFADEPDFSDAIIYAEVNPASIFMPNEKMAGTVQQAPYIDTKQHGKATFSSKEFRKISEKEYLLPGTFQLNGIEKTVTFKAIFNGYAYPNEKPICGFDVMGRINRHDFKIAGMDRLHSGRLIHDDSIEINLALRME